MKIVLKNKKTNRTFDVNTVDNEKLENKDLHIKANDSKEEEKVELSEEELASLKELASLVPELRKLLESKKEESEESEEEAKEEEAAAPAEEEAVEESKVEEAEEEGASEMEEEEDVILEEEKSSEIEEEDEEDVIEDECGSEEVHDSKSSIGSIEVDDSIHDSSTQELEVANAFDSRYKKALNK